MSVRDKLKDNLSRALKEGDTIEVSTVRLISAAIKDRDIANRSVEHAEIISDGSIMNLLQSMIKQREDSITIYAKNGRKDLADREEKEINVIRSFLPEPLKDYELSSIIDDIITYFGVSSIKDMTCVIKKLKEDYPGRVNMSEASTIIKGKLL